eukprot:TRINITY_DN1119_c1_g1_i1.p1 TRINITY_DN1119_c1_g1~~TRINITY_DN1119_c1_g1_i1.p1  ORF type:complete len:116 (+),score=7.44 TRINITY_DN1119_c1_g1_i1:404-751(+)
MDATPACTHTPSIPAYRVLPCSRCCHRCRKSKAYLTVLRRKLEELLAAPRVERLCVLGAMPLQCKRCLIYRYKRTLETKCASCPLCMSPHAQEARATSNRSAVSMGSESCPIEKG